MKPLWNPMQDHTFNITLSQKFEVPANNDWKKYLRVVIWQYLWVSMKYLSTMFSSTKTPSSCLCFKKEPGCKIPFLWENIFSLALHLFIYQGLFCELELVLWNYLWLGSKFKCNHSNAGIISIRNVGANLTILTWGWNHFTKWTAAKKNSLSHPNSSYPHRARRRPSPLPLYIPSQEWSRSEVFGLDFLP